MNALEKRSIMERWIQPHKRRLFPVFYEIMTGNRIIKTNNHCQRDLQWSNNINQIIENHYGWQCNQSNHQVLPEIQKDKSLPPITV